jgi:hypothetical protein
MSEGTVRYFHNEERVRKEQPKVSGGTPVISDVQDLATITIPSGGTTGQVLAKASNDDYDVEWVTP